MSRRAQRLLALVVALAVMLGAGVGQPTASVADLGEDVSIIVSKLNPFDRTAEQRVYDMGGTVTEDLPIVDGFSAVVPEGAIARLEATPGILAVRRDGVVKMEAQMGEGSGTASAVYTDSTRASKVWTQGVTGKDVNVALIDTGVNQTGDLAGQVLHTVDFTSEQDNKDSYGHGTFVAGLIAGTGAGSNGAVKGVSPGAKIVSIKIAGRDGITDVTRLLAAIQWVVTHKEAYGIRVLNLSLGTTSTQSYVVDPLNFAVERAWNSGLVVVVAAGNRGNGPKTIMKPADDPFVITVGATDDKTTVGHSDDTVPTFSSVGPTAADGLAKPDVVAPGKSVISARSVGSTIEASFPNAVIGDTYFKGSGTSFSSAIVAGTAALMIQKDYSLGPNRVKARLMETARGGSGMPGTNVSGAGSVDAYNAVNSTSTSVANQGVRPALGGGSLQLTRGGNPVYNPETGAILTEDEANAALGFNPSEYFGNSWAGSSWNGSSWNGSSWNGSSWNGSSWNGSSWNTAGWTGSSWNGSSWNGSSWNGSSWNAVSWNESQWMGSSWNGSSWNGSSWNGSSWNGSSWNGSSWNGSSWNGSSWNGSSWNGSSWNGSSWNGSSWNGSSWNGSGWASLEWSGSQWY
ncbi:MAG TPA: S8 family serine peptidase [Mycobacteriales bacterium]|nr:S8 family serine peptidase [Mycobacteriales bacterium]